MVAFFRRKFGYELTVAIVMTLAVFSVFVGQKLFSDIVTFARGDDQLRLCYAAFLKIGEIVANGENFIGIDSGSFNGATEFFLRANLPSVNLPFLSFGALSAILPGRMLYMLFYAIHMISSVYVMQRICNNVFNLKRETSVVVASLLIYVLLTQSWYVSFYMISSLSVICFYFSIKYYQNNTSINFLSLVITVIFLATSGYITVAAFALIMIYIQTNIYFWGSGDSLKKINKKLSVPFLFGGIVVLPYYTEIYRYAKNVVGVSNTLFDATLFNIKATDLVNIISSAYLPQSIEGMGLVSIGLITCVVICFAYFDGVIERENVRNKIFIKFNFALFGIILLWAMGPSTPIAAWFYTFIPVLGSMHIPGRYLMVTLPFLYISIGILANGILWNRYTQCLQKLVLIFIFILGISLLLGKNENFLDIVNINNIILDVVALIFFIHIIKNSPCDIKKGYLFWSCVILITSVTHFYQDNGVYDNAENIRNTSLVYKEDAVNRLDDFIKKTDDKNKSMYRVINLDSKEDVPGYFLGNYEWYNISRFNICNYSGYELHLSSPKEYRLLHHPWFNRFDYEYIANTRADYIITDYETINGDKKFWDRKIDWDKGVVDIGAGRIALKLVPFIPSVYNNESGVQDNNISLDNGYFYSHDLTNKNIMDFSTDQNSFFEITIRSDDSSLLLFLPYANRYYQYYIDGVDYQPEIKKWQANIYVDSGVHTVRIEYKNTVGVFAFYCIIFSCVLMLLGLAFLYIKKSFKKRIQDTH